MKERLYLNLEGQYPSRHRASVQKERGVMVIMEALGQKSCHQKTTNS